MANPQLTARLAAMTHDQLVAHVDRVLADAMGPPSSWSPRVRALFAAWDADVRPRPDLTAIAAYLYGTAA